MRNALLIATDTYADPTLRSLRAPGADALALGLLLANPEIGGFATEVLHNRPAHVVTQAVEALLANAGADDLVLLYFSGHGIKSAAGELHLAMTDTRTELLRATSLAAATVRDMVDDTVAAQVVVWLDCCFSGAFPSGQRAKAGGQADVLDQLRTDGSGCAVMTASTRFQYAFEGAGAVDELGGAQESVFTASIVEGLRTGAADLGGDGRVDAAELYRYVHDRVKSLTPHQTPTRNDRLTGEVYIAFAAPVYEGETSVVQLTTEDVAGWPAFHPNGRFLVFDGTVFDTVTWAVAAVLPATTPQAFSRDGRWLVTGHEGKAVVWDVTDPSPLAWRFVTRLDTEVDPGVEFGFDDAGTMLIRQGSLAGWTTDDWEPEPSDPDDEMVAYLVPGRPSLLLALVGPEGAVIDMDSDELVHELDGSYQRLEAVDADGRVAVFRTSAGLVVTRDWEFLLRLPPAPGMEEFCAAGVDTVVTTGPAGMRVFGLEEKEVLFSWDGGACHQPAMSADERFLVVPGVDGLRLWSVEI
ncbi:caspase family protein [Actinosynnema sp. NPDC020468]|uniref:caspase family protein n=1 Tax=Actinosynnema sp. NPDC020468 TaxID=3154488 RepID=UPI0033C2EA5E